MPNLDSANYDSLEYKLNPDEFPDKELNKQTLVEYALESALEATFTEDAMIAIISEYLEKRGM